MIIEKRNTKFGEQIVLIADEGKVLTNGTVEASVAYIGKGNAILDWQEIEATDEDASSEEFENIPSQEEIKQHLIDGVQAYMDSVAKTRGYDNILSACSYINSNNERFDTEGEQARIWRSRVWEFCYAYLDDVLAGLKPIPSLEELINELPKLDW